MKRNERSERVQAAINRVLAGEKPYTVARSIGMQPSYLWRVLKIIRSREQP